LRGLFALHYPRKHMSDYLATELIKDSGFVKFDADVVFDKKIVESTPKSHFVENINFFIFVNCCFC